MNRSGMLRCCTTRVGKDTTLWQMIKLVEEAQATTAEVQRILIHPLALEFVWIQTAIAIATIAARGILADPLQI